MHKPLPICLALFAMAWPTVASTKAKSKTKSSKPSSYSSTTHSNKAKPTKRTPTAAHASTGHAPKAHATTSKPPKRQTRSFQQAPTPERYKEIQQALADRGYFKGAVDGTWGPDSVSALKQFQQDQNLDPDGRIGSLSLIAMGLGPKRMTAQATPPPPTPAVPPVEQR